MTSQLPIVSVFLLEVQLIHQWPIKVQPETMKDSVIVQVDFLM